MQHEQSCVLLTRNSSTALSEGIFLLPSPAPPQEGTDAGRKDVYKMSSKPRGMAIVINNKNFTCGMKDRVGTDRDAENLTKLLIWLGFFTNRYDNLTGKEMHRRLQVRSGG